MVEYSKANVKLSDTQLKNWKLLLKINNPENEFKNAWWKWSTSWIIIDNKTKTKLTNAFNNNMSTDLTLSKAEISKIIHSGGFLGSLLSKLAGPLINIAIPLAKSVLAPLGIIAAASAIDAGIQKKIHGSGSPSSATLIISNKEMNYIMKIVQAVEDSNIFLKGVTKTIKKNKRTEKRILKHVIGYFRS